MHERVERKVVIFSHGKGKKKEGGPNGRSLPGGGQADARGKRFDYAFLLREKKGNQRHDASSRAPTEESGKGGSSITLASGPREESLHLRGLLDKKRGYILFHEKRA